MTTSALASRLAKATKELRCGLRGTVLAPGDAQYDQARRVWNGAIDRYPAIIAICKSVEDVANAVQVAREYDTPLSVRGGGHDWAGRAMCEGGLVIDLSTMREVTVDLESRTTVARGGATVADVALAAGHYGLAPVTGSVNAVGMIGLTLAGGYGPLNGRYGLALDNLLGAQVVLADGQIVMANDDENVDLFWALRGGGGNFGVVTAARYRLHPLESVLAGLVMFPLSQASTVLRGYRELIAEAPDELTVACGFVTGPDGNPALFLFPAWCGRRDTGGQVVNTFTHLGTPFVAEVRPMPYARALGLFDSQVVNGRHYAVKTRSLPEINEMTAALLIDGIRNAPSALSGIFVSHFHGAAARVPIEHTAFAMRRDHLLIEVVAAWEPSSTGDASDHERWADTLSSDLAPYALAGGYPNLLGPTEYDRVRAAYGPNADRLRQVKRRFDPAGVFTHAVGSFYLTSSSKID